MERYSVRRKVLHAMTLAALLAGVVACSSETPGDATPGGDGGTDVQIPTEGGGGSSEPPETTTETESGSPADELAPCDLLTSDEQSSLSLGAAVEEDLGGARSCEWQASGSHLVRVDIWNDLGIDGVKSKTTPEPKTVGSHDAMQYTGELGVCAVALELTETSRVDVVSVAGGDVPKACTIANQAAKLVEPKLP